jgi:hypothetical protein
LRSVFALNKALSSRTPTQSIRILTQPRFSGSLEPERKFRATCRLPPRDSLLTFRRLTILPLSRVPSLPRQIRLLASTLPRQCPLMRG